jgi:hypothetical protein
MFGQNKSEVKKVWIFGNKTVSLRQINLFYEDSIKRYPSDR